MPYPYQFGTLLSIAKSTGSVQTAPTWEGYCTAMVTKSRKSVTTIRKSTHKHLYIEEWMDRRGLNDESLANRIGVARATVTRWRKQQHRLNPGKIAAIAAALDLEPSALWHPSHRPSLDAMVQNAPDALVNDAAEMVRLFVARR